MAGKTQTSTAKEMLRRKIVVAAGATCDACEAYGIGNGKRHRLLFTFTLAEMAYDDTMVAFYKAINVEEPSLAQLCMTCAESELETDVGTAPKTMEHEVEDDAYTAFMYGSSGVKHQLALGTLPALPKKCDSPHFTKIAGPTKKFGYLRLASERGGAKYDDDADYALMFSSGWERASEPYVKLLNLSNGKRADVPDLAGEDRSSWPSIAFIDWPDMGGPPKYMYAYVDWVYDQWKSGKNVQFGCFGSHGRTGTFLALMYIRAGMETTGKAAIDRVHKEHCVDAVESTAQTAAIEKYAEKLHGKVETAVVAVEVAKA